MKKKDLNSLGTRSVKELEKVIDEKRKKLNEIRVKVNMSQEKNLKAFKNLRVELSKVLTVLNEKRITESEVKVEDKKEEKKGAKTNK